MTIKNINLCLLLCVAVLVGACGGGGSDSTSSTSSASSSYASCLASYNASVSSSVNSTTSPVQCSYSCSVLNTSSSVNNTATATWTCDSSNRRLTSNGLPDHATGTFPSSANPNTITAQSISSFAIAINPSGTTSNTAVTLHGIGYALNGVKFDPGAAASCPSSATSSSNCSLINGNLGVEIEAIPAPGSSSPFNLGLDSSYAHVQPNGAYHYHGNPTGLVTNYQGSSTKMTLIGWAADGYPIYSIYGQDSSTHLIREMRSSYQLVSSRSGASASLSTSTFPLGTFTSDYQYVSNSGDLDQCNGRTGITPEFPNGIYHYYVTTTFPFIQRCLNGDANKIVTVP